MSELLAAIPKIFARRSDDYLTLIRRSNSNALLGRAMETTARQMTDAYKTVVVDAKEKNHSHPANR